MSQHQAFLQAIVEAPDDDVPRLIYADFLEEQGDADRADFIRTQVQLARSGDLPVKIPAFSDPEAVKAHRLLPTALAQLQSGAQARPRTPDWNKVESILGTELNKALVAGSGGAAAMDSAAGQVQDYLKTQGYYA